MAHERLHDSIQAKAQGATTGGLQHSPQNWAVPAQAPAWGTGPTGVDVAPQQVLDHTVDGYQLLLAFMKGCTPPESLFG